MFKEKSQQVLLFCSIVTVASAVLQYLYPAFHLYFLIIIVLATVIVLYVKQLYPSIESDQQQVKTLFDHATEGIILTDEKGKIVLLNPAAFRLFKYDQDELPGQSIDVLIPQRFHHSHVKDREGFYQHPSNRTMGQNRDLFARKK